LVEKGSLVYGKALECGHVYYKAFGSTWVWGSILGMFPALGPYTGPGMGPCLKQDFGSTWFWPHILGMFPALGPYVEYQKGHTFTIPLPQAISH
jgi:hypothetical protein